MANFPPPKKLLKAVIIVVALHRAALTSQEPADKAGEGTEDAISMLVRLAKTQGKTKIRLDPVIVMESGISSVDELTDQYNWLRFHVTDVSVTALDRLIMTWYKVKIDDPIKWVGFSGDAAVHPKLPARLRKIHENEGFILQVGGSLEIDGVHVVQALSNAGFALSPDQQYLGAFHVLQGSYHLLPAAGDGSIFRIVEGKLISLGGEKNPLSLSMKMIYNNDYRSILAYLNWRFPQQK